VKSSTSHNNNTPSGVTTALKPRTYLKEQHTIKSNNRIAVTYTSISTSLAQTVPRVIRKLPMKLYSHHSKHTKKQRSNTSLKRDTLQQISQLLFILGRNVRSTMLTLLNVVLNAI
jgi:hypothetical protein